MGLNLIFIAGFAFLGLLISMTAGFWVGNRIAYIVFVSIASSISFAVLGFGVYKVLELKVPEFLSYLADLSGIIQESRDRSGEGSEYSEDGSGSAGGSLMDGSGSGAGDHSFDSISQSLDSQGSIKSGKFGDHIMVDKVAIKNEPKLMAEAIRTMMQKDDENS